MSSPICSSGLSNLTSDPGTTTSKMILAGITNGLHMTKSKGQYLGPRFLCSLDSTRHSWSSPPTRNVLLWAKEQGPHLESLLPWLTDFYPTCKCQSPSRWLLITPTTPIISTPPFSSERYTCTSFCQLDISTWITHTGLKLNTLEPDLPSTVWSISSGPHLPRGNVVHRSEQTRNLWVIPVSSFLTPISTPAPGSILV